MNSKHANRSTSLAACPAPEQWEQYLADGRTIPRPEMEEHLLYCDHCLAEAGELLRDRRVSRNSRVRPPALERRRPEAPADRRTPSFTLRSGKIVALRGLMTRPGPVFRSGARTVIHSDLIPLAADYVILELFNDGENTRLNLEKGAKNGDRINISLYINEQLSDNLQLQRSHSWNLGQFPRGNYTLDLDSITVLKFCLRD